MKKKNSNPLNLRYELKFISNTKNFNQIKNIIFSFQNVYKLYPTRTVNSFYLDNELNDYFNHTVGENNRMKHRLRTYNDNNMFIYEKKIKKNIFNFKEKEKCSDINTVRKQLNRNFTLKTSYQREYYQFKDNFRITFDSKIEFGKLSSSGNLLKKFVKNNFHIIEFKGEEKNYTNDQYLISQIMKDFMSLNGKFSKYIYGIDSIYNSNLLK